MKDISNLIKMGLLPEPNFVPKVREIERNRFGVMVWDHKTAGTCQVLSGESFNKAKQYTAQPGHRSGIKKFGFRG